MPENSELFAVLVILEEEQPRKLPDFEVYIVNTSVISYEKLSVLTGAYFSSDDSLIETSQSNKEKGPLPAGSSLLIDRSDMGELDMTIWYDIALFKSGNLEPQMYGLTLPKYAYRYTETKQHIPVLEKEGMRIALRKQ